MVQLLIHIKISREVRELSLTGKLQAHALSGHLIMETQEIWKDIPGYEGYYQVSNIGRIKSLRRFRFGGNKCLIPVKERIKAFKLGEDGYPTLQLDKDGIRSTKRINRIVASAFIPNPDNKPCVCHIDDNPLNNNTNNLFWATHQENMTDKVVKGRQCMDTTHGMTKLNKLDVNEIRAKYATKQYTQKQLAGVYNVSQGQVSNIILNKRRKQFNSQ